MNDRDSRYSLADIILPHNTHRTFSALRRHLADRTGAMSILGEVTAREPLDIGGLTCLCYVLSLLLSMSLVA
jgi:hypothetical protein